MMKRREIVLSISQCLIILLIVLSIYGAFLGTQKAGELFRSVPIILYWITILVLLISGMLFFPKLRKNLGVAMVHIGAVLIILGGMWSSEKVNALERDFLGRDKIHSGRMLIYEGDHTNDVYLDMKTMKELPFSIMLNDFTIEYYPNGEVKKFISEVEVFENGGVVKEFGIEVNKPMHYGGYYFYQSSYDDKSGMYTVLSVHSDSGSVVSYAGFTMLGVGVFWLLWFKKMLPLRKKTDGN